MRDGCIKQETADSGKASLISSPGSMGSLQIVEALQVDFPGSLGADQLQALSFEGCLRGGLARMQPDQNPQ